mgnify:CR=1 FL=1
MTARQGDPPPAPEPLTAETVDAHCHLDAMGVPPDHAESAIRISLGWGTTDADIDRLVEAWGALYARTRRSAA